MAQGKAIPLIALTVFLILLLSAALLEARALLDPTFHFLVFS